MWVDWLWTGVLTGVDGLLADSVVWLWHELWVHFVTVDTVACVLWLSAGMFIEEDVLPTELVIAELGTD